jgi:hypothetical protein
MHTSLQAHHATVCPLSKNAACSGMKELWHDGAYVGVTSVNPQRVCVHDCSFDTTQQAILKTWLLRRRRHSSWPRSMRSRGHRYSTPLLRPWSKHSRRAAVLRAHDQGVILQKYASQVRVRSRRRWISFGMDVSCFRNRCVGADSIRDVGVYS